MELKHIGRYDIKSLIGQGGMSAVYLAYDPRALREVAIKVLPPYYLHSARFRERFEREAVTIALLEHPAIVPVYDMGEDNGQPYIVMRYMSGGSLADKLRKGAISLRECLDMYLRLAPALDTAHARGVTHRDVKPDNLLFDKYNNVFLSDFGLARLRETIGFANISDGSILGTPAYMSPEQIQGDREIDGRSDIYSLGVVLYHMLAGALPFDGSTAASVMMMHLINPVPQVLDHNASLPPLIQPVLEKAMAKNPQERYQSVAEFARAFQAVITGVYKKPVVKQPEHNADETSPDRAEMVVSDSHPSAPIPPTDPSLLRRVIAGVRGAPAPSTQSGERYNLSSNPDLAPIHTVEVNKPAPSGTLPPPLTRRTIPMWGWYFAFALLVVVALSLIQWARGGFPFSSNPAFNPTMSLSQGSPTVLSQPSLTIGQADKLAFLHDSNIWVSNLDGSGLLRLTEDGTPKSHLNWSPDGRSVIYTSGSCLKSIDLSTRQSHTFTCFSGVSSIASFDISSEGSQVAIGLPPSDLYLLPYPQLSNLRSVSLPEDLLPLAECASYAPYHGSDTLEAVSWSWSDDLLAVLYSDTSQIDSLDRISVLDFSQCRSSPVLVDELQPTDLLFTLMGYYDTPQISSLSWKPGDQLLLNGKMDNAGFGSLELFNLTQDLSREIAPNGACCYRDAHWSPDGTYLFFTFQPEAGGEISLHYVPDKQLDQPVAALPSLSFPAGFFTTSLESLQPALRTVH